MSHGWYPKLYLSIGATRGAISRVKRRNTDGSLAHPQQQKKEKTALKIQKVKVKKKWERIYFWKYTGVFLSVCWI